MISGNLCFKSDHNPLLLEFNHYDFVRDKRFNKSKIRFGIKTSISSSTRGDINYKLTQALNSISKWGHNKYGEFKTKI